MPDWYVKRNDEGAPYPYSVRLGGCEYSLTEEEFQELHSAFDMVWESDCTYCVESEGYTAIEHNIARPDELAEARALLGLKPKEEVKIRRC